MDKSSILLIFYLTGVATENSGLGFLNQLIGNIKQEYPVNTLLIMKHNQTLNCDIQDLNPEAISTLRFNQLTKVDVRRNFNYVGLCVVCIRRESEITLLENVVENFEGMRQERIILWIQTKVKRKLLNKIIGIADKYQLLQMLILEVPNREMKPQLILRLYPFPKPYFLQAKNILSSKQIFRKPKINFKGRSVNVLPDWCAPMELFPQINDKSNISMPLSRVQDSEIVLFAKRYNLSLSVIEQSKEKDVVSDIVFSSEISASETDVKNLNPYDLSNLKVIVPCSRKKTINDVFKHMNFLTIFLYILPVYVSFVVVETFILMVTHRYQGQSYRLTNLNPLLNLRVFRAILGMPFPISQRSSISLKQLFLAISVFGLVYSSFFSCKLSALLTMSSAQPQVKNFDELHDSNISVIVIPYHRKYIENKIGADYIKEKIPGAIFMNHTEMAKLLFSLNDSYAYTVLSEKWNMVDSYQKSINRKVLCDSKDLIIMQGIPGMYVLGNNSIYDWPLSRFLRRIREVGITNHWLSRAPINVRKVLNITTLLSPKRKAVPIAFNDLMWLWFVLGFGYGLAGVVFLVELTLRGNV